MLSDSPLRITILVSLFIHLLFLAIPGEILEFLTPEPETAEDFMARIVIEEPPPPPPKIEEPEPAPEEVVEEPEPEPEPEPLGEKPAVEEVETEEPQPGLQVVEPVEVEEPQDSPQPGIAREPVPEPIESQAGYQPVESRVTPEIDWAKAAIQSYQEKVRKEIEQAKIYPGFARKKGIEGKVKVRFTILSDGKVEEIEIIEPSGSKLLDRAASRTIKRAALFPPLPEETGEKQLQMQINIVFKLE
ncbi:MAG: energy transducer TonB [bacterium]|nr:energy transducer TonB [bacterium]